METIAARERPSSDTDDLAAILKRYRPKGPGIAKYAQLAQTLVAAIDDGVWQAGEKLPTEADLASATPFSLGTVQSAYRSLVEQGVVVRIHGSGTYVAENRHRMDVPWHCRFLDDEGTGYLPVYTKVLSRALIGERGPWSAYLGQSGKDVLCIDRKISIDDEFDVYSKFYVREDRFGALLEKPIRELDGMNFKMLLSVEFGTSVTRLKQTLSVTCNVPPEVAKLWGGQSAVATVLAIRAETSGGEPVYYQDSRLVAPTVAGLKF